MAEKEAPMWLEFYKTSHNHMSDKEARELWAKVNLRRWIDVDRLREREAILLLADIDPDFAQVDWGAVEIEAPSLSVTCAIKNAKPVDESNAYLDIPHWSDDDFHSAGYQKEFQANKVSEANAVRIRKLHKLEHAAWALRRINFYWQRSKHPEESVRDGFVALGYAIRWAREKLGFEPPWLDVLMTMVEMEDENPSIDSASATSLEKFKKGMLLFLEKVVEEGQRQNKVIDIKALPGTKAGLQELAKKFDPPVFGSGYMASTFDEYLDRSGVCRFKGGRPTKTSKNFYRHLFPELFKEQNMGINRE